jgi:hypothetical protein
MTEPLYELLGRLDDEISWERIGLPCVDLGACKFDAQRLTEHYAVVEVRAQGSGRVVHRAVRRPKGQRTIGSLSPVVLAGSADTDGLPSARGRTRTGTPCGRGF